MPTLRKLEPTMVRALLHQAEYTLDTMSGSDLTMLVKIGKWAEWGEWFAWSEVCGRLTLGSLKQHNVIIVDGTVARVTPLGAAVLYWFSETSGAE